METEKDSSRTLVSYVSPEMKEDLRVASFETRRPQTDIVREALEAWLKDWRANRKA